MQMKRLNLKVINTYLCHRRKSKTFCSNLNFNIYTQIWNFTFKKNAPALSNSITTHNYINIFNKANMKTLFFSIFLSIIYYHESSTRKTHTLIFSIHCFIEDIMSHHWENTFKHNFIWMYINTLEYTCLEIKGSKPCGPCWLSRSGILG